MTRLPGEVMLSVLLPVFNAERYVEQALSSVLQQTFADFEVLVLDDGSTDGSLNILRSLSANDPRVRVVSRENRGLVATLNELLAQARGELVARMDADDVCLPDRFARQVRFLQDQPDVVCVGGDVELIDERGRYLTRQRMLYRDADIQREALRGHGTICHPAAMIRRSALERLGGYRAEYFPAEDLDLWLRLGELGRMANLEGPVLRYRLHGGSISGNQSQRQRDAALRGCQDAWRRRGLSNGEFTAHAPWRASDEAGSQFRFALQYGWWAFNSGQRRTAAVYGLKAIRLSPGAEAGWRLLVCALLKPMRPPADTPAAAND